MDSNAYPPLANASIPVQSRVLGPSCCPDKDLVLLISRLGGLDRISLWNSNAGAKVWETGVSDDDTTVHVDGIAWSPDGQSIACMLDPPRVSLHSIQDGRIITSLPLELPLNHVNLHLSDIWWFPARAKATKHAVIPDIFRRNNIITGSSESTLKFLPYLDRLQEESDRLTATNLFAFQGSQTRTHSISQLPEAISAWPTLSPDSKIMVVDSTIQHQSSIKTEEPPEEKDDSNLNSILMVSDTLGNVYSFLDGTFPLGVVSLGREASFSTAEKSNHGSKFFGHAKFNSVAPSRTSISPTVIDMTLLANRKTRDLARLSSIVRDLTWYIMRVVKEMKEVWFGNETSTGARELGPRWVDAFRAKQKEQFGQPFADPILDLTWLLTTGRASEALADFLGSSEQMSERAIQKWDSAMADGLAKLRDYSEKRLTPAFQRVHLVLEELQGWSYEQSRQYSVFQLDGQQFREAIEASARGVVLSSELAAISRRELFRFKEFLVWLRFEIANINPTSEPHPCRHDILEVNNYFVSGLTCSAIDSWFQGEVPQFKPHHLGVPEPGDGPLNGVLDRARQAAADPSYLEWQANIVRNDHSSLPRNLVALTEDLAVRCRGIFGRAAGAASRSARVHHHEPSISATEPNNQSAFVFRERIVQESDVFLDNFLTIVKDHNVLVLVKFRYGDNGSDLSLRVAIVNVQCNVNQGRTPDPTILAAEHFDDETIAVVYRVKRDAFLSTMVHSDLEYLDVPYQTGVAANLEDLVQSAINEWKAGNIASIPVVLTRRRILSGCKHGDAELTVNGRRNRRVACVVDSAGSRLESFDLGEDAEDTEDEE